MPRRKPRKPAPRRKVVWRGSLALVLIDQVPLRRKTSGDCRRLMQRVRDLETEWTRFETHTQPAFERWRSATFGALLTGIRERGAELHELESLVEEVEYERMWNGGTYAQAYQRILRRREALKTRDPQPPPENDFDDEPRDSGDAAFEADFMFEEFLARFMGVNPDRLDDETYETLRREFHRMAGVGPPPEEDPEPEDPAWGRRPAAEEPSSRCRDLYRKLVVRLHPDTGADYNGAAPRLWHDLQEAYAARDCERMEILCALTDLYDKDGSANATLFHLRTVARELRRGLRAIQTRLRKARGSMAWRFATPDGPAAIEEEMREELEAEHAGLGRVISTLRTRIESWRRPKRARRRPAAPPTAPPAEPAEIQMRFL